MFAVRYVALLALVVWLGIIINTTAWIPSSPAMGLACGGVVLVSLVAVKFLGPPPRAFAPRAALVVVMLAVAAYARRGREAAVAAAITLVLGLILLAWYARE